MPTNNQLPPKENALFKRILKCYEQKQYTKGLKFAKQILSVPHLAEHGETLAMKGLTLNCLGRKEEAYDHVRRGLRNDLKSHVCWHVYGLLQRSDRKYDEAIKCYRNALKWDKDNLQILRDLSLLQVQMRDLEGYRDTRYQLLVLRPTQRASWIGFAMAYHLLKQYDMALRILEEFRKTQQPKSFDYEYSELLLYIAMVLKESTMYTQALDHLKQYEKDIVDKLSFNELRAELFMLLDNRQEAAGIYQSLIDRNPENSLYYTCLIQALKLEKENDKLELFITIKEMYPRASVPRRYPLSIATGESFRRLADKYMRHALHKGMPALFVTLKPLYKCPEKVRILQGIVLEYEVCLRDFSVFSKDEGEGEKEPPTALLWTYYYIAQHYSHLGEHMKALEYINRAIDHTPLLIELHAMKAKLYKRAGDMEEAVVHMEEAQSLDTADRYINSKCAKYLLRVCQVQQASDMCAKFARDGVSAIDNLREMQCMWFETECALAFQMLGRFGEALKKCIEVDRHFMEIIEDQFDFHTYCMRKMTLRSYVGLLRLEDVLRSHPFYYKAARVAIEIYLHLHDNPYSEDNADGASKAENLTPAEVKKLRNKERKARKKAAIEKVKQAEQDKKDQQQQQPKSKQDGDMDGPKEEALIPEDLVKVEDPLSQAVRFLKPLQRLASDVVETHVHAYEIYSRQGKLLLMLQCIKRGCRIDKSDDPQFHICKAKFLHYVKQRGELDDRMAQVLEHEMPSLYGSNDVRSLNDEFLQRNPTSILHRLAAGIVMVEVIGESEESCLSLVTKLTPEITGVTVENLSIVLQRIRRGTFGTHDKVAERYQAQCHELFPIAVTFFASKPSPRDTEGEASSESVNIDKLSIVENGLDV